MDAFHLPTKSPDSVYDFITFGRPVSAAEWHGVLTYAKERLEADRDAYESRIEMVENEPGNWPRYVIDEVMGYVEIRHLRACEALDLVEHELRFPDRIPKRPARAV